MQLQGALPAMVATGGGYGNDGLGMGGGLIGGLLLGSLLRNGGLGGLGDNGRVAEGCVTPSNLSSQLANVTDTQMNTTVLQTLGDIKASIPYNEAQVQLALAGQSANLGNLLNAANIANLEGQGSIRANISLQTQALTQQIAEVGNQADRNLFQISQAISADGEKTRALITSNTIAELNQRLTVSQLNEREERDRNGRLADKQSIDINMIQNQNQNQLQQQQQQQAINSLISCVHGLGQNIQATNQAINIGGLQNANPTNSNTNVKG